MKTIIIFIHIIISIGLISLILLQSSQGGLGSAFGGGETYRTKRGAERIIFVGTIIFAALFLITSISAFIIR